MVECWNYSGSANWGACKYQSYFGRSGLDHGWIDYFFRDKCVYQSSEKIRSNTRFRNTAVDYYRCFRRFRIIFNWDRRAGSLGANPDNFELPGVKINRYQSGYSVADCILCSDWFLVLRSDRSGTGVALGNLPSGRCIYWRSNCPSFANCSAEAFSGHSIDRSWSDNVLEDCCLG